MTGFENSAVVVSALPTVVVASPRRAPASSSSRPSATPRAIRATYDAAKSNAENARHWAAADGLSAREANSAHVRERLRNRARYEIANNSYAKGIVETKANDVVGTGPRLQMLTKDAEFNRTLEESFERWSAAVGFAETLRTLAKAKVGDGEGLGLLTTNPRIDHPVQLDVRLVEADQVATPDLPYDDPNAVDGIRFDAFGNPIEYHLLDSHPGDAVHLGLSYRRIPARSVLHWFRADRPGQARGVPEITPALNLFAQLRRYTLAVLAAAETAADFAAVLYTDMPPDDSGPPPESQNRDFETLEIERRMMTTLPAGWKMAQFKAEQPTTAYKEFKAEILNEIARCLNMPFNVAAGNSAGYNYASGRLDHQTYFKSIGVEQYHLETAVLDRVFAAWLEEAYLVTDLLPDPPGRLMGWPHQWFWDGWEHVDPSKEAAAQEKRLANNTTTLAIEWARRGLDWEAQVRQRAKEVALLDTLGLSAPKALPGPSPAPATVPVGDDEDDEGSSDDDED